MGFDELQARVLANVIDAPTAITSRVGAIVNEVYTQTMKLHNFRVMRAETAQTATTADTHTLLAKPSDWKEPRGRPYVVTDDGYVRKLVWATKEAALARWGEDSEGAPRAIVEDVPDASNAASFLVYPLSDNISDWSDGEYRVVIPYWKLLPELTGSDETWLTIHGSKYLTARATEDAFRLDWNYNRADYWGGVADKEWLKLLLADKREALAGIDALVPFQGADNDGVMD